MFSRKKKKAAAQPQAPMPKTAMQDQTSAKKSVRMVPSIISSDLVVTGNLVSGGEVQVDGTIEGDIHAASLVIGDQATITGEVMAEEVIVRGRIIGTLRGLRIILAANCHVEGDIMHESLAVEPGAFFEGNCRRSEDPLNKKMDNAASTAPSGPKENPVQRPIRKKAGNEKSAPVVVKDGSIVVRRPAAE
ncbi:MAG: hypothetical protein C0605_13660 [Hyphomicrobiales bacterium]|nr:MAG: hypothetical protein C0605_13660 [Hyphomicrobiales bacterium]